MCPTVQRLSEATSAYKRQRFGARISTPAVEIRRRTRVVGTFPDGKSALMLVAARLRHVAATRWGTKRYLQMNRLAEIVAIA